MVITKSRMLSPEDTFQVFGNISEIHQKHKVFLALLQERIKKWSDTSTLGDLFLEHVSQ